MSDSTSQPSKRPATPPSPPRGFAPGGTLDTLGRASLMGLHLVSGMIVGALLGYALDRWLDMFPWGSAIGFLFGIIAGFRNVWIDARRLVRQSEQAGRPPHVDSNPPKP